jgi:hypothetical protein
MSDASDLYREVGELQGTVRALTGEVEKLRDEVKELVGILNQGKGAKYLLFILPSVIGGLSGAFGYFGLKFTIGH